MHLWFVAFDENCFVEISEAHHALPQSLIKYQFKVYRQVGRKEISSRRFCLM